jgi:hypothetical protein
MVASGFAQVTDVMGTATPFRVNVQLAGFVTLLGPLTPPAVFMSVEKST